MLLILATTRADLYKDQLDMPSASQRRCGSTAGLERRNNGLETRRERSVFSMITVGKVWARSLAWRTRVPLTDMT
jgi:hypothetical protein